MEMKLCTNCKHMKVSTCQYPCNKCRFGDTDDREDRSLWERKFKVGDIVTGLPKKDSIYNFTTDASICKVTKVYNTTNPKSNDLQVEILSLDKEIGGIGGCVGSLYDVESKYFNLISDAKIEDREFDIVNRPQHYADKEIEVIDYIQDTLSKEGWEGYLNGNIIKYVSRYRHKNGVEDLEKARYYSDKLIEHLKNK